MDTIAEFDVPAEKFALARTLEALNVSFDAERVTAHDIDWVIPLLWAAGERAVLDELEATLRKDPSVESVAVLTELDDERLLRIEWVKDVRFVIHMLVKEDAAILSMSGTDGRWSFRALFPDRGAVSSTYDFCEQWDLGVTLGSVREMTQDRHSRFGLTAAQNEVLVTALDHGYFDVPRGADVDDLAAEIGISRQAVSERLRRAHRKLIRSTMVRPRSGRRPEVT
ncbi:DNA-binding protein [Halobacteriales archaeon QS_3_64_16]|nr:MAG: DNA-binding protein [Halobacteriales archaeon QS_3_64_16]